MRDWRTEQWDTDDWTRARELADEYWFVVRRGLYVYEAERAVRDVAYERERTRLVELERAEWEWYCGIYPDLKEAAEGPGHLVDDVGRGKTTAVDVEGMDWLP